MTAAERRPMDPRRLRRPLRLVLGFGTLALFWWAFSDYRVIRLPDGPPVVFDFGPRQKVLARPYGDDLVPRPGDLVLFARDDGSAALGRLVALGASALEVDAVNGRVRAPGESTWYPTPQSVIERLPLDEGQALILAENPHARDAGAIVPVTHVAMRVLAGLPF